MKKNPNVDQQELAKFDSLKSQWWDPEGKMKPLHQLNPLRLQFIEQHSRLQQQHILDIGCGGGILAEGLAKKKAIVTGIDLSESSLAVAREHAEQNNLSIDYQLVSVEEFQSKTAHQYDVITCLELLEHVPDPNSVIQAISKLIKSGGTIFFSTINRNLKSFLQAIIAAEYILQMLPKGTHQYAKFIRPSELIYWANKNKLNLVSMCGIQYNPLTQKFSLSKKVDVNYLACFRRNDSFHRE